MGVRGLSVLCLLPLGLLYPIALEIQFQDDTVVYKTIYRSRGRHGIFEDGFPLREREVASDHDATALITICQ